MNNIMVSDLMTQDPITISPDTNLLECIKKMVKKRVGSLLIAKDKKLVGLVSEHDILWALTKKLPSDLSKIKAIDISPRKIATIKPNAQLEEAWRKMKKLKFERLPVIKEKELVGLITAKDILNFHPELFRELDEFAQIREESRKLKALKKVKYSQEVTEGICEECGNQEILYRVHGNLICSSCKDQQI
jgi:CBS domain-containing protein